MVKGGKEDALDEGELSGGLFRRKRMIGQLLQRVLYLLKDLRLTAPDVGDKRELQVQLKVVVGTI